MRIKLLIKNTIPVVGVAIICFSTPALSSDGEAVYKKTCKLCHATGMLKSPKFGDKAAWKDRIAKGNDVLYDHAINGFNKMLPKGGKKSLSDDEVKAAVDYMVEAAK